MSTTIVDVEFSWGRLLVNTEKWDSMDEAERHAFIINNLFDPPNLAIEETRVPLSIGDEVEFKNSMGKTTKGTVITLSRHDCYVVAGRSGRIRRYDTLTLVENKDEV